MDSGLVGRRLAESAEEDVVHAAEPRLVRGFGVDPERLDQRQGIEIRLDVVMVGDALLERFGIIGSKDVALPVDHEDQPLVLDDQIDEALEESALDPEASVLRVGEPRVGGLGDREQELHLAQRRLAAAEAGDHSAVTAADLFRERAMNDRLDFGPVIGRDPAPGKGRVDDAHHRVQLSPGVQVGGFGRLIEGDVFEDLVEQRSGFPAAGESGFRNRAGFDRRHRLAVELFGLDRDVAAGPVLLHA